jgi:hypothetical protein
VVVFNEPSLRGPSHGKSGFHANHDIIFECIQILPFVTENQSEILPVATPKKATE